MAWSRVSPRPVAAAALLGTALLLSGCGAGFFGETKEAPPLPGERISIMALERTLAPDDQIAGLAVALPHPRANPDWPQPGGNAHHVMQHPAVGDAPEKAWSTSIGAGSDDDAALLASPVLRDGRIITLDSQGRLTAVDAKTGAELWHRETRSSEEEDAVYSGAVTTGGDLIFVATGVGEVIAVAADTGEERWRSNAPGPIRSAPTYSNNRLFLTTIDNKAVAMSAATGERLWVHSGIAEIAALLGGASPAVKDNVVIVPYSSGELFALKAETGRVFWVDSLSPSRRADAVSKLSDIRGNPVIDRSLVFAISHSGRISALDLRTGARVWDRRIGGTNTPWVAGEFLFLVSNSGEVICLTRRDGRVKWLVQLPQFEAPEDREGAIQYAGPVLAGDRLIVPSSLGEVYAISPYTGKLLGSIDLGDPVFVPPIVAGETIYILSDSGRLTAFR